MFAVEPFAEGSLVANLANPVALNSLTGSSLLCVPHSMLLQGGAALGAQAPARRG